MLSKIYKKLCEILAVECDEDISEEKLLKLLEILEKEIVDYKNQLEEYSMTLDAHLEELSKAYEELSTVFEVSNILSVFEYPPKLREQLSKAFKIVKNAINYDSLIVKIRTPLEKILLKVPGSLSGEELERIEKMIDSMKLKKTVIFEPGKSEMVENLLIVPVIGSEKWGYIGFVEKSVKGIFTAADKKIAETVARQIAAAVDRINFVNKEIERQRFLQQLEIARKIQESLFPRVMPEIKGIEISAVSYPAIHVGGDYYDVLEMGGKIYAVVADVSGKGIPAALLMSTVRSTLRTLLESVESLSELVSKLNKRITEDFEEDRFVTMAFFSLDRNGELRVVNAGHDPVYIVKDDRMETVGSSGVPLGILPDWDYDEKILELDPGTFVVAYTDGVIEARNVEGEEYGFERLEQILKEFEGSAEELTARIKDSVFSFSSGATQHDDTTIMVIKYEGQ
ncbi:MAG: PP2C family protein-serine/threonine phosphatase [Thermotogaceae bacterium]|nr:PP2C family protein-serine/threonine phosphatase [Thermotogaceae bacterium]